MRVSPLNETTVSNRDAILNSPALQDVTLADPDLGGDVDQFIGVTVDRLRLFHTPFGLSVSNPLSSICQPLPCTFAQSTTTIYHSLLDHCQGPSCPREPHHHSQGRTPRCTLAGQTPSPHYGSPLYPTLPRLRMDGQRDCPVVAAEATLPTGPFRSSQNQSFIPTQAWHHVRDVFGSLGLVRTQTLQAALRHLLPSYPPISSDVLDSILLPRSALVPLLLISLIGEDSSADHASPQETRCLHFRRSLLEELLKAMSKIFHLAQLQSLLEAFYSAVNKTLLPKGHGLHRSVRSVSEVGYLILHSRVRDAADPTTLKKLILLSPMSLLTKLLLRTPISRTSMQESPPCTPSCPHLLHPQPQEYPQEDQPYLSPMPKSLRPTPQTPDGNAAPLQNNSCPAI